MQIFPTAWDETVTRCLDIKALTGLPVIKSMGISNIMDIKNAQQYNGCVDYLYLMLSQILMIAVVKEVD